MTSTIAAAAAEIQALINSKPQSPTTAEIEAILRGAWVATEWAALVAAYDAACVRSIAVEASSAAESAVDLALLEEEAAHARIVQYAKQVVKPPESGLLFAAAFCFLQYGFIVHAR
jgi:hypothetical protein